MEVWRDGQVTVSFDLLGVGEREAGKDWQCPDSVRESTGPASILSDPGRRCWAKFPFQGVDPPPPSQ